MTKWVLFRAALGSLLLSFGENTQAVPASSQLSDTQFRHEILSAGSLLTYWSFQVFEKWRTFLQKKKNFLRRVSWTDGSILCLILSAFFVVKICCWNSSRNTSRQFLPSETASWETDSLWCKNILHRWLIGWILIARVVFRIPTNHGWWLHISYSVSDQK
jgi:hypothetical protein